ncbi:hypothetical protein BCR32DRAFT_272067 [Anaeromyces robustus]|uniref:Condensation domain-containing protein n=1 Tax=Anaeromyces robustus TaxID=1754192 RepID=A0A1Y1WNR4_9FUNG|nr:hypothetical protein BCR32DRAFT_272067 [Anaeromyces robustus]|eukprot:ORX75180.1 hypothetical protein BCR32DRAFT_272067 [Anaeromyces robustus]
MSMLSSLAGCKDISIYSDKIKSSSNHICHFYKIAEGIDIEKLISLFDIIIKRHEVLKTVFIEKTINNQRSIYGKIKNNLELNIEQYNINNFVEFIRPFDLTKDSLIRVGLIEKYVLMIDINHTICDGYSFGILTNELFKLYNGESLDELPIQYSDYAIYYEEKENNMEIMIINLNIINPYLMKNMIL